MNPVLVRLSSKAQSCRQQFVWRDGLYLLGLLLTAIFFWHQYQSEMDIYERALLLLFVPLLAISGWYWKPLQLLLAAVSLLVIASIYFYAGQLINAENVFLLKYLLASQSSILWMSVLFALSCLFFWIGLLSRADSVNSMASALCWAAVACGWTAIFVRWYESYLLGSDIGHIPFSNLYEVFILFSLVTALLYLYYQQRYGTRALGAFVLPIIVAAVGFLLWYMVARSAYEIQPLVPALQSWWMKIHVPANFIGYGAFSIAATIATAYLLKQHGIAAKRLPPLVLLDDWMYRAVTLGFAFFTLATILGALWAAEAWGRYWSWDPKETWALIVWLNYAAWLHMRMIKGLRGKIAAWWALIGLVLTLFAFLGVNLFLSGLHSYGTL